MSDDNRKSSIIIKILSLNEFSDAFLGDTIGLDGTVDGQYKRIAFLYHAILKTIAVYSAMSGVYFPNG